MRIEKIDPDYARALRVTGLPSEYGLAELKIHVGFIGGTTESDRLQRSSCLDCEVIPAIMQAVGGPDDAMREALRAFVATVDATGGVFDDGDGFCPAGDPEWYDLGTAYAAACAALGRDVQEGHDPR